jgi:hypothetical protein
LSSRSRSPPLPDPTPARGAAKPAAEQTDCLDAYGPCSATSALGILSVTFIWFAASMGLFIYLGEFFHRGFKPVDDAGRSPIWSSASSASSRAG